MRIIHVFFIKSEAVGEEMMDALHNIDPEKPLDVLGDEEIQNMQGDCLTAIR